MVEELIKKHGEEYRELIIAALKFYEERRKIWGVSFDWDEYIDGLVKYSKGCYDILRF